MKLNVSPGRRAEIARYGVATGLSAVVTLGLPVLLHEGLAVPPRVAVAIAFAITFVLNFVVTRNFVFRNTGRVSGELSRYAVTSVGFRLGEYLGFLVLFQIGLVYYLAQLLVVSLSLVLKFLTLKVFVFGNSRVS